MSEKNDILTPFRRAARLLFPLFILGLVNCSSETTVPTQSTLPPVGALVGYDGCISLQSLTSTDDCIEWEYTEDRTLTLRHVGAGFNCCPGEISADITIRWREILIDEEEEQSGCRCLCLFNVDYEVANLKPGKYKIHVIEPYVTETDEPLVCELDLTKPSSGQCCVERNHYPWD